MGVAAVSTAVFSGTSSTWPSGITGGSLTSFRYTVNVAVSDMGCGSTPLSATCTVTVYTGCVSKSSWSRATRSTPVDGLMKSAPLSSRGSCSVYVSVWLASTSVPTRGSPNSTPTAVFSSTRRTASWISGGSLTSMTMTRTAASSDRWYGSTPSSVTVTNRSYRSRVSKSSAATATSSWPLQAPSLNRSPWVLRIMV